MDGTIVRPRMDGDTRVLCQKENVTELARVTEHACEPGPATQYAHIHAPTNKRRETPQVF